MYDFSKNVIMKESAKIILLYSEFCCSDSCGLYCNPKYRICNTKYQIWGWRFSKKFERCKMASPYLRGSRRRHARTIKQHETLRNSVKNEAIKEKFQSPPYSPNTLQTLETTYHTFMPKQSKTSIVELNQTCCTIWWLPEDGCLHMRHVVTYADILFT